MSVKISILLIILFGAFLAINAQTPAVGVKFSIVNGLATYLPKPEYSQEAKDFCASGTVSVKVEINEKGDVSSAETIVGDELLRDSSIEAAKKAKFRVTRNKGQAVKVKGIIVYNFPAEKKCITVGIVNKRAKLIPKPEFPKSCRCQGRVVLEIIVEPNGSVIKARALSGHPLLRDSAVKSALATTFSPIPITTQPIYVRAQMVFDFSADGKVGF